MLIIGLPEALSCKLRKVSICQNIDYMPAGLDI